MRDDYKLMEQRYQPNALPIAITGASYAGLTLGNVLHLHSIPYAIFDSKSPPYTHVSGGAKFNIPSYELVTKKLELDVAKYCLADNGPTRKEVIDSLLQRVTPNLITSQRILRIENRSGLFYLHSISTTTTASNKNQSESTFGPFQHVVGADGVLSKIRTSSLLGTFLCGDARWVNDRWYDLGLQRIDRGADIALQDGLELGEALCNSKSMEQPTRSKFCALEISWRRTRRRRAFSFAILALFACKFQSEISHSIYNMMYTLKDAIFIDDCLSHNRKNPLVTFEFHETSYALLVPNIFFWIQLSVLILIQSIISVILSATIYYGIIQRRGSIMSYLLCWSLILPFAVTLPIGLIRFFNIQNRAVLLSTAATPTLVTFRCLEAVFGFSPHSVEDSLWNYCIYYSSVIEFVFDKKTRSPAKATRADVIEKGRSLVVNLLGVSFLLSFMEAHNYQPFDATYVKGHIGNNFLAAVLTSSTVATGTAAFGFAICWIVGILTLDVFDNPMFKSTSVTNFWGKRWNRLVHGVLKRGVYKPVRKYTSSVTFAALATFVMSGLLHEYVLMLKSMPEPSDYAPSYGNQFSFFVWNGMLIVLEYIFINWTMAPKLEINIPPTIKSMLIVLMALPVSHWFTDEYIRSGLFSHYAVGFPIIARLE